MSYTTPDDGVSRAESPFNNLVDHASTELDDESEPSSEEPLLNCISCAQVSATEAAEIPQNESFQDPVSSMPASTTPPVYGLTLPRHWEQLVDIFFDYTSCWFPLIERHQIMATASEYTLGGLITTHKRPSALDAQLWAVLAVASFQDAASADGARDSSFAPDHIFAIACYLSSLDGDDEIPCIRAFLLQSLLLLGQQKVVEAWALIGKATRLASGAILTRGAKEEAEESQLHQILEASFILETLAALCLGHADAIAATLSNPPYKTTAILSVKGELQRPVHNSQGDRTPRQPQAVFRQIHSLCRLWILNRGARQGLPDGRIITTHDLLQNLDSQFSFCNSLLLDTSTTTHPAMLLLQAMFLSISLDLAPRPQPALLLNLWDLAETYSQTVGPSRAPPLMITLMSVVDRRGHTTGMNGNDKVRYDSALNLLQDVWRVGSSKPFSESTVLPLDNAGRYLIDPPIVDLLVTMQGSSRSIAIHSRDTNRRKMQDLVSSIGERTELPSSSRHDQYVQPLLFGSLQPAAPDRELESGAGDERNLDGVVFTQQQLDNDAILDELSSIHYQNPLDADLQFMANLGFLPGCDLGEMFLSNFSA